MTDAIKLAAEARPVIAKLHERNDVVVQFSTNESEYIEDRYNADEADPGHFRADKIVLKINLDRVIRKDKPAPKSLATIEDFRQYPVLAGVAAHESAHARFTLWEDSLPKSIPNPDYDPAVTDGSNGPEVFPVSRNGKLYTLAEVLEEPRAERLATNTFTKTWQKALTFSAAKFVLEAVDEDDANGEEPLDAAVKMAILVGGREMAGTLGTSFESRNQVRKVLDSAKAVIEKAVQEKKEQGAETVEHPFDAIMQIINRQTYNNDHTDAASHLESARQILAIVYPEDKENPDSGGGPGYAPGASGEGEGEGEESGGGMSAAMSELAEDMKDALEAFGDEMQKMQEIEEDQPESGGGGGYGAVQYKNNRAPQIGRHEQPNDKDRELYRRAREWMENQIEPTVTEYEIGQWLPGSGSRLNVRSYVRDNLANHKASQRSDWDKRGETVKPAPPVKVGIMLDGSGSMHAMARPSAAIAWAAANAAADLPESRTVSVVYGSAAQVTQEPGHVPAKTIAVSNTDGPWENFTEAAWLVSDALRLDEPTEEGAPLNTLIVIVSDLHYGGSDAKYGSQWEGFMQITKAWSDQGIKIMVVGADPNRSVRLPDGSVQKLKEATAIEFVKPEDLFKN